MYAGSRSKGDDNPQRGNALKLSTARSKEKKKEKRKEKRNQRKEKGRVGEESTQLLELQLDRKLRALLANPHFEQAV